MQVADLRLYAADAARPRVLYVAGAPPGHRSWAGRYSLVVTRVVTEVPAWLRAVRPTLEADVPSWWQRFAPPPRPPVRSAVLMLFAGHDRGDGSTGYDVVLTQRSPHLRAHAHQASFPGGKLDPGDDGPIDAALREAEEEVGVDPPSVTVVDLLPGLYMHPSQNAVTPVLGWWRDPHPIAAVDEFEVARVVRADLDQVLDPARRFTASLPEYGYTSPAFEVDGLYVWGFTAMLLDHVLTLGGINRPWDSSDVRPVPARYRD